MSRVSKSSKRPVLIRSAMMIGLEVAPVAPKARFVFTSVGSTESSHSFVPVATSDCNGVRAAINFAPKLGGCVESPPCIIDTIRSPVREPVESPGSPVDLEKQVLSCLTHHVFSQ